MELKLSRRALLTSALGLGAASARCRSPLARRRIAGTIAGPDVELGHKLRDGAFAATGKPRDVPAVIVGGGVAGLSAAWRLARRGFHDFEVLELDRVAGGTSRGGQGPMGPVPWGAHYVPCPLPHAAAMNDLLVEAGVATRGADGSLVFDETQLCRAPQERIFVGGRWSEGLWPRAGASAEDERQLAAFNVETRALSERADGSGRRAFAVPVAHGSDDAAVLALDRISMARWMDERGFTSRRLRWFVEYATRDDFGSTVQQTSAWAALHYFCSRQVAGRSQEVLTWPDGNAHLVAHLAGVAGARLRTGVAVTRIEPAGAGAVVHTLDPSTGRAEALRSDRVVVAVPRAFAARLLGDEETAREARLFPTGAWLVANLALSRPPVSHGFSQAWDNVFYGSSSLGYVVATHQLDRPPGGAQAWTWYLPLLDDDPRAARTRLLSLTHEQICQLVISDLRPAHPDIESCVERIDAWKWGHAMVRPAPGLQFSAELRAARQPRGALHWAHTELSGMALFEEAQHHGVRAADEVLAAFG